MLFHRTNVCNSFKISGGKIDRKGWGRRREKVTTFDLCKQQKPKITSASTGGKLGMAMADQREGTWVFILKG